MKTQSDQEMYGLYQFWHDSRKSKAEFAKEKGLVLSTFYFWAKKFNQNYKGETVAVGGFNRLDVVPSSGYEATVRISYPSGITVELYGIPDSSLVRSLTE
jgi:hypothetical protein